MDWASQFMTDLDMDFDLHAFLSPQKDTKEEVDLDNDSNHARDEEKRVMDDDLFAALEGKGGAKSALERRAPFLATKRQLTKIEKRVSDAIGKYEEASQNVLLNLVEMDPDSAIPVVYKNHTEMMTANKVRIDRCLHQQDANRRRQQTELHDASRTLNRLHNLLDMELNSRMNKQSSEGDDFNEDNFVIEDALMHADQVIRLDMKVLETSQERSNQKVQETIARIQGQFELLKDFQGKIHEFERISTREQQVKYLETQANEQYQEILRLRSMCENNEFQLRTKRDTEKELREKLKQREDELDRVSRDRAQLQVEVEIKRRELNSLREIPETIRRASLSISSTQELPQLEQEKPETVQEQISEVEALKLQVQELQEELQEWKSKATPTIDRDSERQNETVMLQQHQQQNTTLKEQHPTANQKKKQQQQKPSSSRKSDGNVAPSTPTKKKKQTGVSSKESPRVEAPGFLKQAHEKEVVMEQDPHVPSKELEEKIASLQRELKARDISLADAERKIKSVKSKHLEIVEVSSSLLDREHELENQILDLKEKLRKRAAENSVSHAAGKMVSNLRHEEANELTILRRELEFITKQRAEDKMAFEATLEASLRQQREELTERFEEKLREASDAIDLQLSVQAQTKQRDDEQLPHNEHSDSWKNGSSDDQDTGCKEGATVVVVPKPVTINYEPHTQVARETNDLTVSDQETSQRERDQNFSTLKAEFSAKTVQLEKTVHKLEAEVISREEDNLKLHDEIKSLQSQIEKLQEENVALVEYMYTARSSMTGTVQPVSEKKSLPTIPKRPVVSLTSPEHLEQADITDDRSARVQDQVVDEIELETPKATDKNAALELQQAIVETSESSTKEHTENNAVSAPQQAIVETSESSTKEHTENNAVSAPQQVIGETVHAVVDQASYKTSSDLSSNQERYVSPESQPVTEPASKVPKVLTSTISAQSNKNEPSSNRKPDTAPDGVKSLMSDLFAVNAERNALKKTLETVYAILCRDEKEKEEGGLGLRELVDVALALKKELSEMKHKLDLVQKHNALKSSGPSTEDEEEAKDCADGGGGDRQPYYLDQLAALAEEKRKLETQAVALQESLEKVQKELSQETSKRGELKKKFLRVVATSHKQNCLTETHREELEKQFATKLANAKRNWEFDKEMEQSELQKEIRRLENLVDDQEAKMEHLRLMNKELLLLEKESQEEQSQSTPRNNRSARGSNAARTLGGKQMELESSLKVASFKISKLQGDIKRAKQRETDLVDQVQHLEHKLREERDEWQNVVEELQAEMDALQKRLHQMETEKKSSGPLVSEVSLAVEKSMAQKTPSPLLENKEESATVSKSSEKGTDISKATKKVVAPKPLSQYEPRTSVKKEEDDKKAKQELEQLRYTNEQLLKRVKDLEECFVAYGASQPPNVTSRKHMDTVRRFKEHDANEALSVRQYYQPIQSDQNHLKSLRKAFSLLCKATKDTLRFQSVQNWETMAKQLVLLERMKSFSRDELCLLPLFRVWLSRARTVGSLKNDMFREKVSSIERALAKSIKYVVFPEEEDVQHIKSLEKGSSIDPKRVMLFELFGGGANHHILPIKACGRGPAYTSVAENMHFSLSPTQLQRIMAVTSFIPPQFAKLPLPLKHQIIAEVVEFVNRTKKVALRDPPESSTTDMTVAKGMGMPQSIVRGPKVMMDSSRSPTRPQSPKAAGLHARKATPRAAGRSLQHFDMRMHL